MANRVLNYYVVQVPTDALNTLVEVMNLINDEVGKISGVVAETGLANLITATVRVAFF